MSRTVAEALVDVLEEVGVKHVFGLIGDSLNPLGDRQGIVCALHHTGGAIDPARADMSIHLS